MGLVGETGIHCPWFFVFLERDNWDWVCYDFLTLGGGGSFFLFSPSLFSLFVWLGEGYGYKNF